MIVKELIEELKKYDEDLKVELLYNEDYPDEVERVFNLKELVIISNN